MKRTPTDAELARAVRTLEKKFLCAGKRVIVVNITDAIEFAKSLGAKPLTDQSGNENHLWPMPRCVLDSIG